MFKYLLLLVFSSTCYASEFDELAPHPTSNRSNSATPRPNRRRAIRSKKLPQLSFRLQKANEDLNTMHAGNNRYTQPSRAQLLDYGKFSGV